MGEIRPIPGGFDRIAAAMEAGVAAGTEVYLGAMALALAPPPARTGREYYVVGTSIRPVNPGTRTTKSGKASIAKRGGGRRYYRIYIASAPGEMPALLFGKLRQSRAANIRQLGSGSGMEIVAQIGSNLKVGKSGALLAIVLERGSSKAHIAPRPAWLPTLYEQWPNILDAFDAAVRTELAA